MAKSRTIAAAQATDWAEPELTIVLPDSRRLRHPLGLAGAGLVVGRSRRGTDVCLADPQLSDRHLRLFVQNRRVVLEDLGSRSGTWLNGSRVTAPRPLSHGDKIACGGSQMVYACYRELLERVLRSGQEHETVPTPQATSAAEKAENAATPAGRPGRAAAKPRGSRRRRATRRAWFEWCGALLYTAGTIGLVVYLLWYTL